MCRDAGELADLGDWHSVTRRKILNLGDVSCADHVYATVRGVSRHLSIGSTEETHPLRDEPLGFLRADPIGAGLWRGERDKKREGRWETPWTSSFSHGGRESQTTDLVRQRSSRGDSESELSIVGESFPRMEDPEARCSDEDNSRHEKRNERASPEYGLSAGSHGDNSEAEDNPPIPENWTRPDPGRCRGNLLAHCPPHCFGKDSIRQLERRTSANVAAEILRVGLWSRL
ncbi:hypothetical protein GCM10010922_24870 [Microbacterium sorbitolivorans]|nr:hypothetical protein GCM10010922_24870 [Microbacterium sorbitolivorans]